MTEKRFTIDECGNITDTVTNRTLYVENRYTECNYYVNLLNTLVDENEQLKQKVDFYKYFQKDARELEKENEELKSELKIYRKIANCGNCEYHNYDWYDDGDEFEVCDKKNDMWYRICEDWRELE